MKHMNVKGGGDEVHGVRQKTKSRPKQGGERETGKADKDKTRSRKRTCKFCGQSHEYKK